MADDPPGGAGGHRGDGEGERPGQGREGRAMTGTPSPNGSNGHPPTFGRDGRGRFAEGNRGGPGNPHARRTAELRAAMLGAVSADDVRDVIRALVERARTGDTAAARELLDRTLGKAGDAADLLARLDELESRIAGTGSFGEAFQ
ncbi:MAG: hypothetical protein KF699_12085 [Phycisphaeraceae bacterium]|nr:hypothetical protein [Phycisphaeraceae bacterium]